MLKKNSFKQKIVKNRKGTMKSKSGCQKLKKIFKQLKLNWMNKDNKALIRKIGEKIMKMKIQSQKVYKCQFIKNF